MFVVRRHGVEHDLLLPPLIAVHGLGDPQVEQAFGLLWEATPI
jgi:hypothetical protein